MTVVRHAVLLDGKTCLIVWQALRGLEKLPPGVAEVKDALRLAASAYLADQSAMSADGPIRRTSTDLATRSDYVDLTASQIADRLHVTPRHVRRIADRHGITPVTSEPYRWDAVGVALIRQQLACA